MAATPLNPVDRYIHPEQAAVYLLLSAAVPEAVTRPEMDAGIDLTGEIADMTGWDVSANRVPVPDLGKKFVGRVAGRIDPGDSQIVFYADRGTQDIRDVLSRGDQVVIQIMHGGDIAGQKSDVYEVEVSAISKPINVTGEPARIMVDFAILRQPAEDVEIPA